MWWNGFILGVGLYGFTRSMIPKTHRYVVDMFLSICRLYLLCGGNTAGIFEVFTAITTYPFDTRLLQRDTLFISPSLTVHVLILGAVYSTLQYGSTQTLLLHAQYISIITCSLVFRSSHIPYSLYNILSVFEVIHLCIIMLPRDNMILKTVIFTLVRVVMLGISMSTMGSGLIIISFTLACQLLLLYQLVIQIK